MKNFFVFVIAFFCCFSICFSQTNPNPSTALDAYIQNQMNVESFPGVSTLIVKNGAIVWVESYGFADIQNNIPVEDTTVFMLASVSKLFTGTASMQLAQNGTISLDRDINNYLPWALDIPGFVNDSVTIRKLMTHTASIADNGPVTDTYYGYPNPPITLANCMQRYFSTAGADYDAVNNFHNQAPGTLYDYSNMATALNGYITEVVSGTGFDAYCDANIFNPLCMKKTSWNFNDFDSMHIARPYQFNGSSYVAYPHYGFADYPDGQLRSNVMDLANFMLAYLNGGSFGGSSIISPASIAQMWTLQVPTLDPTQGLNWYQEQITYSGGSAMLWGHNGGESGVSTDLYLDPTNNIGIVVLTNGEGDALAIVDALYDYARSLNPAMSIVPACNGTIGVYTPDKKESMSIKLFPNPASNQITVNLNSFEPGNEYKIAIENVLGQELMRTTLHQPSVTVNLSTLKEKGIYFVRVIDVKGNTRGMKKLVLQ